MTLTFDNLLDTGVEIRTHGNWTPKDSEERIVRVPRQLIENLRLLPRIGDSNLVFPTAKGHINNHLLRTLKRTAMHAGLDPADAWLHKFRATYATHLLRAGFPIVDVANQLGHSSIKTTLRYLALLGCDVMQTKIEAVWG